MHAPDELSALHPSPSCLRFSWSKPSSRIEPMPDSMPGDPTMNSIVTTASFQTGSGRPTPARHRIRFVCLTTWRSLAGDDRRVSLSGDAGGAPCCRP